MQEISEEDPNLTRNHKTELAPLFNPMTPTAEDLMTPNPIAVRETATIAEAEARLDSGGVSEAHVVDEAGHPVGVITRDELSRRDPAVLSLGDCRGRGAQRLSADFGLDALARKWPRRCTVRDVMTPAQASVSRRELADGVLSRMLELGVGQLSVVDEEGQFVGVVGATDVLKALRHRNAAAAMDQKCVPGSL